VVTATAGRAWCFGDAVDTDVMLPGHALRLPLDEAAQSAFEAVRPGWAATVGPGDVVIGGHDFGTGSARPAGAMLRLLGVRAVLAESMSSLFQRNAVNAGLLALAVPGVAAEIRDGERIELDDGLLRSLDRDVALEGP
jgi:3-isopropylmalate/(R)-2-methylmalate dehydratase small subunit